PFRARVNGFSRSQGGALGFLVSAPSGHNPKRATSKGAGLGWYVWPLRGLVLPSPGRGPGLVCLAPSGPVADGSRGRFRAWPFVPPFQGLWSVDPPIPQGVALGWPVWPLRGLVLPSHGVTLRALAFPDCADSLSYGQHQDAPARSQEIGRTTG